MAEVARSRVGVNTYLVPAGPLSEPQILASLEEEVSACLAADETQLIIDFSDVPSVNSQVLELMLEWRDALLPHGGSLTLVKVNPVILDVLWITGVSNFIDVLNSSNSDDNKARQIKPVQSRKRLGDMLIETGMVSAERIDQALQLQASTGQRMGSLLVDKGWVAERDLLKLLGDQLGIPYIHLRQGLWDPETSGLLDSETAKRLKVMPLFKVRGKLVVATSDPQDIHTLDEVRRRTGLTAKPVIARGEDIVRHLSESFSDDFEVAEYLSELEEGFEVVDNQIDADYAVIDEMATGSPVVNLINATIQRAIKDGASDIHIEPGRNKSRIRFRLDGVMYEVMSPARDMHPALVSRLKVMANLDIAERRLPQDGRIQVNTQGRIVDLRFSSLPGIFGEKVVLRVLDRNQNILQIDKLGMSQNNESTFYELLKRSHGLILVTGPTGSGKTTTLYGAINYLNSIEKSIVTIEDPVEYQLDIVNQNQVKEGIGLSFAKLLKHVLRQDPDIVMVGEIRERETAEIAVQAALTGHLVLSTLHTNESSGAVTRLMEMGIEPYLLSSALIGIIAQRLVRTVCQECKSTLVATPEEVAAYGWVQQGQVRLVKGRGCPACYDSGYRGRMGIHEILKADAELQRLMVASPTRDQLADYVSKSGMETLYDDGLQRVLHGQTTIEEISRVVTFE